jgi:Family of unknown function (DUF6261)
MIDSIDLKGLRNAEYIQFMDNFRDLVIKNDPNILGVTKQQMVFVDAIKSIESLFKLQLGNKITEEIQALDLRRDNAINGITLVVTGYVNHFDPTISKAAQTIAENLKTYGVGIARENLMAETAILNSIIGDWENKQPLAQAIKELNLNSWKDELQEANALFDEKYLARTQDYADANPDTLLKKREECNQTYYELRKHIDAHGVINETAVYKKTTNDLNALIEQYNTLLNNRLANADKNNTDTTL